MTSLKRFDIKPIEGVGLNKPPLNKNAEVLGIYAPFKMLLLGGQKAGKTVCEINILENKNILGSYFDRIYCFGNSFTSGDASDWEVIPSFNNPKKWVKLGEYTDETLAEIIAVHDAKIQEIGLADSPKTLLLFDDCMGFKDMFQKNSLMATILTEGRHWNISLMLSCQSMKLIPPIYRKAFSNILLFYNISELDLKYASEEFSRSVRPSDFRDMFKRYCRKSFDFIHIARETGSNDDQFRYKLVDVIRAYDDTEDSKLPALKPTENKEVKEETEDDEQPTTDQKDMSIKPIQPQQQQQPSTTQSQQQPTTTPAPTAKPKKKPIQLHSLITS